MQSRHGSGTYIPDGPPALGTEPLHLLASLHDFTHEQMYDARRIFEVGAAGLAAECATPEQITSLADQVASLFAATGDPQCFLAHEIDFHRAVAAASGNPIIAAVVEMVSALMGGLRTGCFGQAELGRSANKRERKETSSPRRRSADGGLASQPCFLR